MAECLGKLCLIDPDNLLPKLKMALTSPSALMRTTVVTAMKFTISDQPQTIDPLLRLNIGEFLGTLTDADLNVRRVALVALNSAAHNKPSLVRDLLKDLLPHLYNETQKVGTNFDKTGSLTLLGNILNFYSSIFRNIFLAQRVGA